MPVIANTVGASGSGVVVTGADTKWQVSGALIVGNHGLGQLSVTQGASVSATSIDLGALSGGFGNLVVNGIGSKLVNNVPVASQLTSTGKLIVGDVANADMSIGGGATVSVGGFDIGLNKGSSGVVDVEGASTLNVTGALNIGVAGNAVMSLGLAANVTAGSINIGKGGVLVEFGDPITTGTITNNGTVNITGGVNVITATAEYLNNGAIIVTNGATEQINTPLLDGTGGISINSGGIVILNADSVAATQTITFQDNLGGVLYVSAGKLGGFHAVVNPFIGTPPTTTTDRIVLNGIAGFTDSISADGKTLTVFSNGGSVGSVLFTAPVSAAYTQALVQCFAAGTRIDTMNGPVSVETLSVGDQVVTVLGGSGTIVWAGSRVIDCTRHPRPEAVWPVRIECGAFGDNMPVRDLLLSPDHAVYVDGVLIPAKHLINGTTVTQQEMSKVVYHHIELERHDVVLAEGLPAETYLDIGDRSSFTGGAVIALHPDFAARSWEMSGCAELVLQGEKLDAVRALLAATERSRAKLAA